MMTTNTIRIQDHVEATPTKTSNRGHSIPPIGDHTVLSFRLSSMCSNVMIYMSIAIRETHSPRMNPCFQQQDPLYSDGLKARVPFLRR